MTLKSSLNYLSEEIAITQKNEIGNKWNQQEDNNFHFSMHISGVFGNPKFGFPVFGKEKNVRSIENKKLRNLR